MHYTLHEESLGQIYHNLFIIIFFQIFKWFKRFRSVWLSLKHSGSVWRRSLMKGAWPKLLANNSSRFCSFIFRRYSSSSIITYHQLISYNFTWVSAVVIHQAISRQTLQYFTWHVVQLIVTGREIITSSVFIIRVVVVNQSHGK